MSMLEKRLNNKPWYETLIIQSDPDDADNLILPLPPELLERMGWDEDTDLDYEVRDDGIYIKEIK